MKSSWRHYRVQSVEDEHRGSSSIDEFRMTRERNMTSATKKNKRFRSAFTTEQVTYLEKEFRKYPYIGNTRRKDVASVLSIPERAVKIWFQNRRMKEKKDILIKAADNKRVPTSEPRPYFFISKLDQSCSSDNRNSTKKSLQRNIESGLKVNEETKKHIIENTNLKIDIPNSASGSQQMNVTSASHSKTEIKNSPVRKSQDYLNCKKPVVSNDSHALPQDLSSNKNLRTPLDNNNHKELKTTPEISPQIFSSSGVTTAGNPGFIRGYYPQSYMPPGNMMWKPVNISPIMATGLSEGPTKFSSPQSLPKVNCTCDCHSQTYGGPMVLQQGGPSPLMQYIITAVPISN